MRKKKDGLPNTTFYRRKGDLTGYTPRPRCFLTSQGRTMPLAEWARELGVDHKTITYRLRKGWTVDDAVSVPASSVRKKNGWAKRESETVAPYEGKRFYLEMPLKEFPVFNDGDANPSSLSFYDTHRAIEVLARNALLFHDNSAARLRTIIEQSLDKDMTYRELVAKVQGSRIEGGRVIGALEGIRYFSLTLFQELVRLIDAQINTKVL